MSILDLQYVLAHLDGKCDFVYQPSSKKIITVGADCLLKIVDIKNKDNIQQYEQDDEIHSITINPKDNSQFSYGITIKNIIKTGGTSNKVEIFNNDDLKTPNLAMTQLGQIIKLQFDETGQYLGCASEENYLSIYDTINKKTIRCKPGHQGSALNLAFSYDSQYICSTGCDGEAQIYLISNLHDPVLVKSQKISKELKILGEQVLEPGWKKDKNIVGLPGSLTLGTLTLENDNWVFESHPQIYHDKDIIIVNWSDQLLITSGLDLKLKIWSFEQKSLIKQIQCQDMVQSLQYVPSLSTVLFMDQTGKLGFWKDEFKLQEFIALGNQESGFKLNSQDITNENQIMEIEQKIIDTNKPQEIVQNINDLRFAEKKQIKQNIYKQISYADKIINIDPQDILHSSSTEFYLGRRFLCWNIVGSISLREENEFSFLDIEFSDHNFHRNIIMPNINKINMATMNYMGAIMGASNQINEDEYLDIDDENSNLSCIQFKHFSYQFDACDWEYKLPEGEEVQCVCIGNDWCAFSTDLLDIRIFNFAGIEIMCFSIEKPIVCLDGYEDQLAYVYHDGPSFYNCQSLKMRVYNTHNQSIMFDIGVPITPKYTLKWFGYSQEGLIITQDTKGLIRTYTQGKLWQPIYKQNHKNKFWLIGVWDYDILGVYLNRDELEPLVYPKSQIKKVDISMCLMENESQWWISVGHIGKMMKQRLINQHERFRISQWQKYKISRDTSDPLTRLSDSIYQEIDIIKKENEIEKSFLELFRESIVKGENERAMQIVIQMIQSVKSIKICILLCTKMNLDYMSKKLIKIQAEKEKKQEYINKSQQNQQNFNEDQSYLQPINNNPVSLLRRQKTQETIPQQSINLNPRTVTNYQLQNPIEEKNNFEQNEIPDKDEEIQINTNENNSITNPFAGNAKKFQAPNNMFENSAFQVGDLSKKRELTMQQNVPSKKFGLNPFDKKIKK